MIRARLRCIRVAVENGLFISLEEVHLELLGVDHGRAQVQVLALEASWSIVTMFGADFEIYSIVTAPSESLLLDRSHRASYRLLSQASVVFNASLHLIEPGRRC